jgi:chromosomal replication initiator protein
MNTASRTPDSLSNGAPSSAVGRSEWNGFLLLPENQIAARAVRSMCRAVLAGKRPAANPLVLHGPPGTGKSRLVAALTERLATNTIGLTVQTVAVGDYVRSPDESFADRDLFECDLLALEDVQHLTTRTAEVVADLIDRRSVRRRATIATASAGPAGLTHLSHRLTSRLAGGLVMQLEPLSATSRRAILADAALDKGIKLTADALDWLANQPTSGGVRVTLGLLQNLAQVAKSFPGPLGRTEVEQTVAGTGQPTLRELDVATIVKRVAAALGVTEADLLGASRLRRVLRSRQVAMYLARELTGLSLPRLGAAFGGRDHTTVLHACRKVEEEMASDAALAKQVSDLRNVLGFFLPSPLAGEGGEALRAG